MSDEQQTINASAVNAAAEHMRGLLQTTREEIASIEEQIANVDVLRHRLIDRKHEAIKLEAAINVMESPDPPRFRTQAVPTTGTDFYHRIIVGEMKFADIYATACRDLGLDPTSEIAALLRGRMGTQLSRAVEKGALIATGERGDKTYRSNPDYKPGEKGGQ